MIRIERGVDPRRGYSLLELMIALAVMVIVISQVLLAFSSQHESQVEQEKVIDTQQDVRLLADAILGDLRMGGYMVSRELGVGSIDGGTADPDIICTSDPSVISDAAAAAAPERFSGAEVTTNLTGNNGSLNVTAGDLDIDGDGDDDFLTTNGGILISDGTRVHCATITSIGGTTINFDPSTPSGLNFDSFDTYVVPAIVYQVSTNTLTRNGLTLSTQIEDMQVQFGVDDDSNGNLTGGEFPIDNLHGAAHDLSETKTARLILTSRSARNTQNFSGQRTLAANRNAGSNDNFKRRRVTVDVALRNAR